jgi:peptidoglycan hydrolase-like protein with peptidoglycan-binding domain
VTSTRTWALWLALALAVPVGPARAQDPTEVAFWSMVRESRNPADVKAYLEAYPRGAYADAARRRLSELERASAEPPRRQDPSPQRREPDNPSPQPYQPPGDTRPALTDPSVIREVQERLYNLNYEIAQISGRMTDETRKAIREWQSNIGRTPTGDMTMGELVMLRQARLPTTWGALAFGERGASAVVWKRESRNDAVNAALSDCRGRNQNKPCKVVSAPNAACGALGFYMAGNSWGAYAVVAPTLGKATGDALNQCRQQGRRPDACGVRITFCADGSHQQ